MSRWPPFNPHFDVLAVVFGLILIYEYTHRRIRPILDPAAPDATGGQRRIWYGGVVSILVGSWWPVHDLAEQTLISAHMLEHMIIGYLTPMLLLRGMSPWLVSYTIGRPSIARWLKPLVHPAIGFFFFNFMIVFVHWPEAVTWQNTNEFAHLALHVVLFISGLMLWIPVVGPSPLLPRLNPPMQMLYLFLNTIVPIVPASFLTFSSGQIYTVYGDAAQSWGLTPVGDQTIAGLLMKLVGGFYLLGTLAIIWFKWSHQEREWERRERAAT